MDMLLLLYFLALVILILILAKVYEHYCIENIMVVKTRKSISNVVSIWQSLALMLFQPSIPLSEKLFSLCKEFNHEPFLFFNRGLFPTLVFSSPQSAKTILIDHFHHFEKDLCIQTPSYRQLLGKSIFMLNGDKWKVNRLVLDPSFHHVGKYWNIMTEKANTCVTNLKRFYSQDQEHSNPSFSNRILENWSEKIRSPHSSENSFKLAISDVVSCFCMDLIGESYLDCDFNYLDPSSSSKEEIKARHSLDYIIKCMNSVERLLGGVLYTLLPIVDNLKMQKSFLTLDKFVESIIDKKRVEHVDRRVIDNVQPNLESSLDFLFEANQNRNPTYREDMHSPASRIQNPLPLSSLLKNKLELNDSQLSVSDANVRDNTKLFLLAGHAKTASSLCFLLLNVALNERVQTRLYDELRNAFPERFNREQFDGYCEFVLQSIEDVTTLDRLPYVECVIRENLRLNPPIGYLSRISKKSKIVDGIKIRKNCRLLLSLKGIQNNIKCWGLDAETFNPERFLNRRSSTRDYSYLPFGAGERVCPGDRFTILEQKIFIAHLLWKYQIRMSQSVGNVSATTASTDQQSWRRRWAQSSDNCLKRNYHHDRSGSLNSIKSFSDRSECPRSSLAKTSTNTNIETSDQTRLDKQKDPSPKFEHDIQSFHEIPGPKGLPLVGNAMELARHSKNINQYFVDLVQQYGDMVRLNMFGKRMLILANPELHIELARVDEGRSPTYPLRQVKKENGMILTPIELESHEDWQQMRKLYNVALKPDFLENISLPQLTELNSYFLKSLITGHLRRHDDELTYECVNVWKFITQYTFNAVLKIFLGEKLVDENLKKLPFEFEDFVSTVMCSLDLAIKMSFQIPLYKIMKTKDYLALKYAYETSIDRAQTCIRLFASPSSSKPRLKEIVEEKAKDMERKEEAVAITLASFLMAGVDITARVISILMFRLAHEPEYQEQLFRECVQVFGEPSIDEITSENGLTVTFSHFKQLKLVKHFVSESMRLNHVGYVASTRFLQNDITLGGYFIPKKTQVMLFENPAFTEKYVPHCTQFIPERYNPDSPYSIKHHSSITNPFGLGARQCPGSRVAKTEVIMSLINIIRHFKLKHSGDEFPKFEDNQSLFYIDMEKYKLYLTPREHLAKHGSLDKLFVHP
ncbi:hypothetical protein C9374_014356 [Naegleria lovaniensis]|uniref:Cytochrome P450 n=1 Tax=Naegleria lovaniensis TaxID=51637 RepID=A0AA88GZN1_NAELO|nr:uncharacterized protein C9374_014356 [Naegleria lovaniensis]KAG2388956.1 hypothetical protein C9374_014356 [Naegleria lovaniensis]